MATHVGDVPLHEPVRARRHRTEPLSALSLAALGVVFGDIGTSPLYAFAQCFSGDFPAAVTPANVLGILSLIFWALVVVVCVKYIGFLLRADYDGQGGTLALLAQLIPPKRAATPMGLGALALIVLFGSSMLYGDGAITPAISVISAIEGLDIWTTAAHPFIVPLSVAVLVGLFAMQKRGTGRIGNLFGPDHAALVCIVGGARNSRHHAPSSRAGRGESGVRGRVFRAQRPAQSPHLRRRRSVRHGRRSVVRGSGALRTQADHARVGRRRFSRASAELFRTGRR